MRGGSVCLNSFQRFVKWISAAIMLPPLLVSAGQGMNEDVDCFRRSGSDRCQFWLHIGFCKREDRPSRI